MQAAPAGQPPRRGQGERRPKVLAVLDWFLPGFKAGGPIRAVANLTARLGDEFEFLVITRDRDLGDAVPYAGDPLSGWVKREACVVRYLPPAAVALRPLLGCVRERTFDLLYLNSVFSAFTWRLLLLRNFDRLPGVPILIAPRGELAASALRHKAGKKRAFLALAHRLSLYSGLSWQASSSHEADDIYRFLAETGESGANVTLAPELPGIPPDPPYHREPKRAGTLRAVFLSRVNRVKNLEGALEVVACAAGNVQLDVWGAIEDGAYWQECQGVINGLPPNICVNYRGVVAPEAVQPLLAGTDVLLLPSQGENYGHAIVEALQAGCPVLISDRTPWRGLANYGAGWDLPLDQQDRFRAAVAELIRMDEVEHARMRASARAYARAVVDGGEALEANRLLLRALTGSDGVRSRGSGT